MLHERQLYVPSQFQQGAFRFPRTLQVPEGAEISVYAAGFDRPRFFDFDDEGNLYFTDIGDGSVFIVRDEDEDGAAEIIREIDGGLRSPNGIDEFEGDLYVAEHHRIAAYRAIQEDGSYARKDIVVNDLPTGGMHVTRTILVGPDRKLYVSIGSTCNACEERDPRNAAIVRYALDGTGEEVIAKGLRNSVGITFRDDRLWATDNGRDRLGDDLPPEEVNVIEEGKHYGWPYCYGRGITDPQFPERAEFCHTQTELPALEMQAHSAPLGLAFAKGDWGEAWKDHLFIAFHGSWNRSVPTGYKVIAIDAESSESVPQEIVTGWGTGRQAWGRPVGIGFGPDGALYVSDDRAGAIYRVTLASGLQSTLEQ